MGKHAFLVLPPLGRLDSKVIWHKVWCRNSGMLIDRWYFTDERVPNGSVSWKPRACRYTPWLVLGLMVRHLLVSKCPGAVFGMLRLLKAFCWLVTFYTVVLRKDKVGRVPLMNGLWPLLKLPSQRVSPFPAPIMQGNNIQSVLLKQRVDFMRHKIFCQVSPSCEVRIYSS